MSFTAVDGDKISTTSSGEKSKYFFSIFLQTTNKSGCRIVLSFIFQSIGKYALQYLQDFFNAVSKLAYKFSLTI